MKKQVWDVFIDALKLTGMIFCFITVTIGFMMVLFNMGVQ
jgi:hypothetical protein